MHYHQMNRSLSILWIDISTDAEALEEYDISFDGSMRFLHTVNHSGQAVVGVSAFTYSRLINGGHKVCNSHILMF